MTDEVVEHYSSPAKWLHWVMAAIIVAAWALGFYVEDLPKGPDRTSLIQLHKAVGSTILILIVVRLAWRLNHQPPALPATIPAWQQTAAHWMHWLLYGLMLAQPLSGWAMSSANGYPVKIGGLIPLPALVMKNETLADIFKETHELIGFTLVLVIIGHIAIALKHHFIDHDGVLLRMAPNHAKRNTDSH